MMRRFFAFALFAAFAAGVSFAALADPAVAERSISIVASETPGAVKLVFGEAPSQDTLYLHAAYGATDGGDTPGDWEKFVYVADVTADMTEYDCALPSGWGTSVTRVRYFLTTEHVDYSIAYEYIKFKGDNANGSYFKTGYAPIPSKTHIVADFTSTVSRNMAIFCSRGASSKPTFTQLVMGGEGFRFDCGPENTATYQTQQISVKSGTRCLVESGPNLTVSWDDGSDSKTHPKLPEGTNFTTTAELYLFATHSNGGTVGNCACGEARFVRIYESDTGVYDKSTLVHEYLPALNPNTGAGALYDTVAHQFIKPSYNGTKGLECTFENPSVYEYETAGSTETFAFVPRTLEVVSVAQEGGTTKATLAVSAGNLVREAILLAFGDYDYGAELSAWPTNEILSVVSPDAQKVKVAMPSCWNTAAYSSARFFLVHSCSETMIDDVAQTVTKPIFASSVSTSVVDGSVKIKVTAPEGQTWYASLAYGMTDMGPDPVAWCTNVVAIADGSGTGSGEVVCALPVGWRTTMKAIRVFLSSAAPMMTYEYLKGDGKACLDLGRKGIFGDMVEFKCKYNSGVGGSVFGARLPNTEGAEKNNFSVQGSPLYLDYSDHRDSRAQGSNINPSEWLKLIVSPTLRQVWQGTTSRGKNEEVVNKPFETDNNLWLFNVGGFNGSPLNGCVKDFELRHIEGSVTNDVMRLVPVRVEDNIYGMFDEVRGRILLNAASSGAFSVEGAAETGLRAYPAYKCTGVSDPVNRGGLVLMIK